jgi:hypothetical protein
MGSSGGGNQTVFFSVIDSRVAAAAPTNAPTLIAEHAAAGSGAYCHCEAIPGLVAAGVEYHDLLAAIAPRPVRVLAGIRDPLFPIIGARKAVEEAAIAHRALGAPGGCTLEEHYCEHNNPDAMRLGTYAFFARALKRRGDVKGPGDEGEDVDLADPRLRALPKPPVRRVTVAELYRRELARARPGRPSARELNRLLGRRPGEAAPKCLLDVTRGESRHAVLLMGDGGVVPVTVRGPAGRVGLVLSDGGKEDALARGGGRGTASLDWRGQGETAPPADEWQQRALHYLAFAGRSLVGGRVTDVIGAARWLRAAGYEVSRIAAFGGEACLIALLAAAVEPDFPRVELDGMLRSFKDAPGMSGQVRYTAWAPGLALATDIPQLLKGLGTRARVVRWLTPGPEAAREGFT